MSSKDSQCRQQRLMLSPHFMTKDTWMLAKGRKEEEEEEERDEPQLYDEFQICKGKVTHVCGSERPHGRDCIFEVFFKKSDKGVNAVTEINENCKDEH